MGEVQRINLRTEARPPTTDGRARVPLAWGACDSVDGEERREVLHHGTVCAARLLTSQTHADVAAPPRSANISALGRLFFANRETLQT